MLYNQLQYGINWNTFETSAVAVGQAGAEDGASPARWSRRFLRGPAKRWRARPGLGGLRRRGPRDVAGPRGRASEGPSPGGAQHAPKAARAGGRSLERRAPFTSKGAEEGLGPAQLAVAWRGRPAGPPPSRVCATRPAPRARRRLAADGASVRRPGARGRGLARRGPRGPAAAAKRALLCAPLRAAPGARASAPAGRALAAGFRAASEVPSEAKGGRSIRGGRSAALWARPSATFAGLLASRAGEGATPMQVPASSMFGRALRGAPRSWS